jgi:hypothetical protein
MSRRPLNPEEKAISKFREIIARRAARIRHSRNLRSQVLAHYGDKCACPGCDEWRREFLSVDHIDGGGSIERGFKGRGATYYRWIIKQGFPKHLRLLCHNCNMARGFYGYCPHERSK